MQLNRRSVVAGLAGTALSPFAAVAAENQPETVIIATGSPGGVYYPYGQGLAALLTKDVGVTFAAQATQGTVQNVRLVEQGAARLGMTTMGIALQGWKGTGWANGTQYRSIRALFPMYDTPFQFVAPKRLHLGSLAGFAGKRIGAGPKAGTGGTYLPEIFNALDIPAVLRYGAWQEQFEQTAAGDLDGVAAALGSPEPELKALDAKEPLDFLQFSSEQVALIRSRLPELSPSVIPAGAYPSLQADYHTLGLYNFAITNRDAADDLAYRIVKAVFEHHDEMLAIHPTAKETLAANLDRDTFLPLHPGAARYYREAGIAIPANLVSTN